MKIDYLMCLHETCGKIILSRRVGTSWWEYVVYINIPLLDIRTFIDYWLICESGYTNHPSGFKEREERI